MKLSSLQKGLVGHWPLDIESLKSSLVLGDKTPYGNDGISANTPIFTADRVGQANRAMSFNGSTDVVDCGEGNGLFDFTNEFSLSAWIKPSGIDSYNAILTKYGINTGFDFLLSSGRATMGLRGTGNFDFNAGPDLRDGNWHHVIAVNSTTQICLNVDGIQYTAMGIWVPALNNANLCIGVRLGALNFNGEIADVRAHNRLLYVEEQTALHEMYRPKVII